MKNIGLIFKETSEGVINNRLKDAYAFFVVKYSGLSSPALSALRQSLKNVNSGLFVVKNTVVRRALKKSGLEPLVKNIEGPCGLIFVKEEPVAVSRVLMNFIKDHEQLKLEGGSLKNKFVEKKDIEEMSKLPAKEVMRAQVVCALNAPIAGFVVSLNQILAKFVYCLEQIRQKKE